MKVIYQCKKVSLAAFSLPAFFDSIDLLTFTFMFRNIEYLCVIYNSYQRHFQFIVKEKLKCYVGKVSIHFKRE